MNLASSRLSRRCSEKFDAIFYQSLTWKGSNANCKNKETRLSGIRRNGNGKFVKKEVMFIETLQQVSSKEV